MYYITNQNNQIIAIDPSLLALLGLKNIDELYGEVALKNATFSLSSEDETVTIATVQNKDTYHIEKHDLSSLLGNMTLIQIGSSSNESIRINDDVPIFTSEKEELVEDFLKLEIAPEEEISLPDDDLMFPEDTDDLAEKHDEKQETLFLIDDSPENEEIKENTDTEAEKEEERIETVDDNQSSIVIDIENISQNIGISTEDYTVFLNEYIDTALSLEKDLQSAEGEKHSYAINTLSHLSNVLHLPVMSKIITQIDNAAAADQNKYIESLYATLSRLTTSSPTTEEELLPILKIDEEREGEVLSEVETVIETTDSFGHINLNDVTAIHFDFQPEEAAKDLNLPTELISEFVNDFIAQAQAETQKMLDAYEKGDLETIKKIGHLLKGASSNLRITPLSDTLHEIQFCEDDSQLEALIKNYWGHFLFLEMQTKLASK